MSKPADNETGSLYPYIRVLQETIMTFFKRISLLILISFFTTGIFATTFTGFTGGMLNYSSNDSNLEKYDPDLTLQAFLQGQFNFSDSVWAHTEFSINTEDFIDKKFFDATQAAFQINEMSLTFKSQQNTDTIYYSCFMGTYDPIGSDIFLRRYFGIQPIASKLTESWLGMKGSIIYPHFGVGFSAIKRFSSIPLAAGGYAYINHEDNSHFVFNADLRIASVTRFLSFDFAGGLGTPIEKNKYEETIASIEKIYWHAGTTLLIGNNYTQSLFIQAGLNNVPMSRHTSTLFDPECIYLLFEPRFKIQDGHVNLSLYSVPKSTAEQLMYVENSLGINANIYSDAFNIGTRTYTIGTNFSASLADKNFMDVLDFKNLMKADKDISITPYLSTNFISGTLNVQSSIKIMKLINKRWFDGITADIGYSTKF